MMGYVLICRPDGTQTLVERELPEFELEQEAKPSINDVLNTLLGVTEDE